MVTFLKRLSIALALTFLLVLSYGYFSSASPKVVVNEHGFVEHKCPSPAKPFGAQTKEGVDWNYNYYDYILIAQPLWTQEDVYQNAKDNNIPQRDAHKVARPFKVIELLKGDKAKVNNDVIYMKKSNSSTIEKVLQRKDSGVVHRVENCYNGIRYKGNDEISYLIFAKSDQDGSSPVIVRMTSIPKNTLSEIKLEDADVVFSGFIAEREKKGDEFPPTYLDTFIVKQLHKNNYFQKTDIITLKHRTWITGAVGVAMFYNPKQQVLIYATRDPEREGYFKLFVTADISSEIELLKKRRDR